MSTNKRSGGFTLIEMMIVVAIIGIISAVAYPSYQNHVVRTRRAAATACMSELANAMERSFTTSMEYTTTLPTIGCVTDNNQFYTIGFDTTMSDKTKYVLQAVPVNAQTKDTKCGTLTLDNKGVKGEGGTEDVSNCWK